MSPVANARKMNKGSPKGCNSLAFSIFFSYSIQTLLKGYPKARLGGEQHHHQIGSRLKQEDHSKKLD